ncbi:CPBP family intramembrane glutamic endopeptidase [Spirosoma sp. KUDC1026]|uniref:CPBP family intramembrane glutamic endopeptidase n=1 Tax=Spirosoma sp. KUDC1026 TaxID=2745947 RepID=UPI00159BABC3|nr:CPBP family intramembrane glutamic endopeptidase [Spirosoma sp. KUDC1026]QKZ11588.1 CPBP family intramembrane metalloprotease [Spirosoma sp. KUDC1026]
MKALLRDLRDHIQADFRPGLYAAMTFWVALLLTINYYFDLEDSYIDAFQGDPRWPALYFLLYATVYYGSVGIWSYYCQRPEPWRNRKFWLRSSTALICYSIYSGFYAHSHWSRQLFDGHIYVFAYYCLHNLQSILTIILPLYLFYRFIDRPQGQLSSFYGLAPSKKGLALYAVLLGLMIPLIAFASVQPDFLASYPTYHDTNANEFFGVSEWVTALIYELCYGWDFVPTELLFRGFLVIGMGQVLGRGAVLPMVVWYCSIHFGRPLGEAISSIFGGYLLGMLALSTRSIWGGLLIHIGIAWSMELAAFLQKIHTV